MLRRNDDLQTPFLVNPSMDPILIKRIVEAALLAASQPLTLVQLHGLFPLDAPAPDGSIAQALEALQADCAERGDTSRRPPPQRRRCRLAATSTTMRVRGVWR